VAFVAAIPESVRELLATGPLAHVVTLDPTGVPHVSIAWAGVEGDQLVFASFFDQHKINNLRRDPRVTLSFLAREHTGAELWPYLVVQGRARIQAGGALELMDRLAEAYIGPGQRYGWREAPSGFVIHVTPEKIYGLGPWRGAFAADA
jgi:PPOX class probable F420-dependent enzyme